MASRLTIRMDNAMSRTPFIAGNWKMHKTLREARELVEGIKAKTADVSGVDILLCPPVYLLFPMSKALDGTRIMLGAQNVHEEAKGAFTGEISAGMLVDAGCQYVIIGHSERRHVFGETNDRLNKKVRAAMAAGLNVIYCVGETLDEREAGRTQAVVDAQIDEVLVDKDLGPDVDAAKLTIAYEPVWAIGTGKTATPEQAQEVHAAIRARLGSIYGAGVAAELRIQYGGSVKPGNAAGLLAQPDIDGALVGGACLVADDFAAIISAASGVVPTT